ncbi:S-layer homology domain-containing protein [Paenibacillus sp. MBLB4367]|uniref:S-layer homology domain-containing protein n=1 Tax=Paenibacillus sp. MBLB4367 TaxID=3384767 RepID=UPI003908243E
MKDCRAPNVERTTRESAFRSFPDTLEVTSIIDGYRDGYEISNWAKESVARMSGMGVFQGDDSQSLRPLEPVTRAETAVLLIRMLRQISFIEPS